MTRLQQWLTYLLLFGVPWLFIISGVVSTPVMEKFYLHILLLPLLLLVAFGLYTVGLLMFKVATFNDCPEAAAELRVEIEQARADLASKGFKFD